MVRNVTSYAEIDHPRDRTGRFCHAGRPRLHLAAAADVLVAADQEWPADEPDVVPDDDPFCGGATTWKGAGFSPAEADEWFAAGITDPDLASEIRVHYPDVDLRKFREMHAPSTLGPDPRDAYTLGEAVRTGEVAVGDLGRIFAAPTYDPDTDPF